MGKPLNFARLLKAAFTFDGAARYALWKIERHTGLAIALTPWRERHPILAAPGVLWRVWRTDRKSVVLGKSVSVRVDLGGRCIIKKKNKHIGHWQSRIVNNMDKTRTDDKKY